MATFTYPYFHHGLVGLSAGELKTLYPLDMRALCEAFKELTGVDPLARGVRPHQAWKGYLDDRNMTILGDPRQGSLTLPDPPVMGVGKTTVR